MAMLTKLWTLKYGYHFAWRYGDLKRSQYARRIGGRPTRFSTTARPLDFAVAMLVGRASLPDMCRSLASLVAHVGQPQPLLIASDGTADRATVTALLSACGVTYPCEFQVVDGSPLGLTLAPATAAHPMVRKLTLIADLIPAHGLPTLYVDSDVVFFPAADDLAGVLSASPGPAYMLDKEPTFDARLIDDAAELASPANGGFLWLPRALNWDRARDRLARLGPSFEPTHFTEQTAVHLAMHDSGGVAFDPRTFVLSVADQFEWRDRFADQPGIVCRHYVRPVRHKMWMLPLP